MKRSEIAMIILIASLSMLFTFTLAQSLLGDKVKRKASVEQATKISQDLVQPAKRTFNKDAINPTVEVCVEKTQTDGDTTMAATCTGSEITSEATMDNDQTTSDSSQQPAAPSSTQSGNKTTN